MIVEHYFSIPCMRRDAHAQSNMSSVVRDAIATLILDVQQSKRALQQELERVRHMERTLELLALCGSADAGHGDSDDDEAGEEAGEEAAGEAAEEAGEEEGEEAEEAGPAHVSFCADGFQVFTPVRRDAARQLQEDEQMARILQRAEENDRRVRQRTT